MCVVFFIHTILTHTKITKILYTSNFVPTGYEGLDKPSEEVKNVTKFSNFSA